MNPDGSPDLDEITKAGEVAVKGIDVLGKIFPGVSARSLSKAESKVTDRILDDIEKIRDRGSEIGLSDESVCQLMTDAVRRHSRNENFNHVLTLAAPMVSDNADPSKVDREWAEHFRDHSEKVSNDEVAVIWAKLLAEEVNRPGSISKRTMSVLADMEPVDAQTFAQLCTMCVLPVFGERAFFDPWIILIEDESGATFNSASFSYAKRSQIELFGLIDSSLIGGFPIQPGGSSKFLINDELVEVENRSERSIRFSASPVLTRLGRELAKLCDIGTFDGLSTLFAKKAMECGLVSFSSVSRCDVIR